MKIVLISILFILFVSCNDSSERTTDVRMICFKDTNKEELKKENIKYEFVQLETTIVLPLFRPLDQPFTYMKAF